MVEITAPTTPEELADWLTFHAADIPLAIHRAPGQVERTTLAELDEKEPAEAERWRGFFRWQRFTGRSQHCRQLLQPVHSDDG